MDLEQEEGRMHHLLALVGSGRAGRGRREERAQSGEAEGECEGENGERGGGGEDYKAEGWRERGGGNPSFPCTRLHLPPASGESIFLAAERSLSSRESPAAKKRNPFLFPGSQARGSVLYT